MPNNECNTATEEEAVCLIDRLKMENTMFKSNFSNLALNVTSVHSFATGLVALNSIRAIFL